MSQNFVTLVNKLSLEAGVSGAAASVATVVNQTGEARRLVAWVKDAHTEIQNRSQFWRWMRSKWTVDTTAGDDTYAPTDCTDSRLSAVISRFGRWIAFDENGASNMKIYLTSGGVAGERWLIPLPWSYFQALYKFGPQNNGSPIHVTIDPQNNIVIGPKPDAIYTMSGEYQMGAKILALDADEPEMPERFQDAIWLRAMEKYGRYHAAPEVLSRGEVEGMRLVRELEADQMPSIALAEPLA